MLPDANRYKLDASAKRPIRRHVYTSFLSSDRVPLMRFIRLIRQDTLIDRFGYVTLLAISPTMSNIVILRSMPSLAPVRCALTLSNLDTQQPFD